MLKVAAGIGRFLLIGFLRKSGYIEGTILRRVSPKVKGGEKHWTTRKHEDGNSWNFISLNPTGN